MVTLLLQLLGVKVSAPYVNEVVSVACGILMLFGVITPDDGELGQADDDAEGEKTE